MNSPLSAVGRKFFCMETMLHLTSNQLLYIENCKRIVEYNEIRIVLQTNELLVSVWGNALEVDTYATDAVRIHGEICQIELLPKGGASI